MNSESLNYHKDEIQKLEKLLNLPRFLTFLFVSNEQLSNMKEKMLILEQNIFELETIPTKFNEIFSERGWIAYGGFNFESLKTIVNIALEKGIDEAEEYLINYYSPENIEFEIGRCNGITEFSRRIKNIKFAHEDYLAKRYYSLIPILLITIDGIVNEILGKGFHSNHAILSNVWDSITTNDGAIDKLKSIFQKGRYKTNEEPIYLPYRNGIIHGLDINYDNPIVAAKCWHFLFVILDWAISKQTETTRKTKLIDRKKPKSFRKLISEFIEIEKTKEKIDKWKPRNFGKELEINIKTHDFNSPEFIVSQFCDYWIKGNYGEMSKFYNTNFYNQKTVILRTREQFKIHKTSSYSITKIIDEAPAISEVFVNTINGNLENKNFRFRLTYQDLNGDISTRDTKNGKWTIVIINEI